MEIARKRFENQLTPILDTAFRVALNMSGNRDDASDVVQESALRAFRSFHTFQEGTNFRAWFLRIVTNYFLEWRRKRVREPLLEDDQDFVINSIPQKEPSGTGVMGQMEVDQVQDAIRSLPDEYRMAASLYFMEDMSYQQISQMLSCPVGTVRSRLHRGRRLLKRALRSLALNQGIISAA
ncbi:MAG: sigma-70 family RNA polymerase sigma factor [Candidatus Latescibacteria bacterium]|jgi:RNA polymerase sigma-70 factor, ECF subfamily|nr:sigma-70 family RNA polymerase sigma factor [Candidatus Latescibacterota bacterium]